MPILTHIGYTVDWKQVTVITWGGLRGAVGLALALVVVQTPSISLSISSKVCPACHVTWSHVCIVMNECVAIYTTYVDCRRYDFSFQCMLALSASEQVHECMLPYMDVC